MPADLPDQPANVAGTLGPLGMASRPQQRADKPAFSVRVDQSKPIRSNRRVEVFQNFHNVDIQKYRMVFSRDRVA